MMGWVCSTHGEKRNRYGISLRRPKGRRTQGIPRHKRENNIKVDLREMEWAGMCWIDLSQDRKQ
jgi:hypothetical protein